MPRQKVTLTLSADILEELRGLVAARSLSAAVERALAAHLDRLRHVGAVGDWLVEMEREHGPVLSETLDWAAKLVDQWNSDRRRARHVD
jgi:acetylornithine deacetylase/succinyl-diaminopimelate desuccinylase-like protein